MKVERKEKKKHKKAQREKEMFGCGLWSVLWEREPTKKSSGNRPCLFLPALSACGACGACPVLFFFWVLPFLVTSGFWGCCRYLLRRQ